MLHYLPLVGNTLKVPTWGARVFLPQTTIFSSIRVVNLIPSKCSELVARSTIPLVREWEYRSREPESVPIQAQTGEFAI